MWFVYSVFRYWKFILILGLTSAIGFGMWQLERKNKKIYELELMVQEKVFYLESLEDAVDLQNEMIDEIEKKNELYEDALEDSKKQRLKIREEEKKRILNILNSNSGNSCEENMDWLVEEAQRSMKWGS